MSPRHRTQRPAVVLSVGTDPDVQRLLREQLASDAVRVVEGRCAGEARERSREGEFDLVLLDAAIAEAHELVRELSTGTRAPILVLTNGSGVDGALQAGASDCILTPLRSELLRARVELALRCSLAEREVARMSDAHDASGGALGLPDRRAFTERLDAALAAARPEKGHVAVVCLAADPSATQGAPAFGASGATRAHVLRITVQRLRDCLRSRDMVGRAATDEVGASVALLAEGELAIVLDGLERPQDAFKVAQRLQQNLAQPIDVDGSSATMPTCFGIALHPDDGARGEDMLSAARGALATALQQGKGAVRFARQELNTVIFERLALEGHLRHALERNELTVYYQPRVSIATGRVVGVEALLRWKHPELGMVSPGQFIPVAEESGLILPIGAWVLREACRQNRRWRDAGFAPIRMAVNLSPAQFREPDLIGLVQSALNEAGLEGSALELELTESMLLQKGEAPVKTMAGLKAMGVHMSIDDFGTGYSSLNYIKRFPVDALKIDQSFIRDLMTSEQDSTLTTSIVLMGKGLNLTVVAEGVETRSQLGLLRALGCDEAQGFLFCRPLPPGDVEPHLRDGFGPLVNG